MLTQKTRLKEVIPRLRFAGLRQQINALTLAAEKSRTVREFGNVEQIADRLLFITPVHLHSIADYYRAVALRNSPESTGRFEVLTEGPLAPVRARAQLALGTQAYLAGDYGRAESRYASARYEYNLSPPDPLGQVYLAKMCAVLQSVRGNHEQALHQLNQIWHLTRGTHILQCDILNSVAVELLALGQGEQASQIIHQVTASPFVRVYPEWLESRDQISLAAYRPSSVTVPKPKGNIYRLADYRQAKLSRIDYEHRSDLCDQIVFGSIRRVVDRADLSLQQARRIIRILND